MGFDGAAVVWLDCKILKMKGCPDVVVIVLVAVLIMVVCGLPNKFPNGFPLVDDAITLLPTLLLTGVPEANKPVKLFTLVTVKKENRTSKNSIQPFSVGLPFGWLEELNVAPNTELLCGREATSLPLVEEVNKLPVELTALVVVAKCVKRTHINANLSHYTSHLLLRQERLMSGC